MTETTKPQGTNVYEGKPDARQSPNILEPVSRFRPRYRAFTDEEKALHDALKDKAAELEVLFQKVKPGRYNSLAVTPEMVADQIDAYLERAE